MMKKAIITIFIISGTVVGFIAVWFRQSTDTIFLLNVPGTILGDAIYSLSIRFIGDPSSSQAHSTIPWLLRVPQVYVPASILFWGMLGTLFATFFKPKTIAIIIGLYLIAFGIVYLLVEIVS